MPRRKQDKSTLKGNHGAERTGLINPTVPIADVLNPPVYLHAYAVEVWRDLFPALSKAGALKATDIQIFTSFCVQCGLVREAAEQLQKGLILLDDKGRPYSNPAEKLFRLHSASLLKIAVELGLSPRARQGVSITQTDQIKADDKLSKLLGLNNGAK